MTADRRAARRERGNGAAPCLLSRKEKERATRALANFEGCSILSEGVNPAKVFNMAPTSDRTGLRAVVRVQGCGALQSRVDSAAATASAKRVTSARLRVQPGRVLGQVL